MLKPVILALDVHSEEKALSFVDKLADYVDIFKVGPVLFYKYGRRIVDEINKRNKEVFLDVKLFDIPNTIKIAVEALSELNIYSLTVHISGGGEMLQKVAALKNRPKIWGVSVLTSFNADSLKELGVCRSPEQQVESLARIGLEKNIDGIVSSAHELQTIIAIKKELKKEDVKCVVPGIRPAGQAASKHDDQKRIMCAGDAVKLGADFLVIGRPILESADPVKTVSEIYDEIKAAR